MGMSLKTALDIIASRNGRPREDDWELMEAAQTVAKHLGWLRETLVCCDSELSAIAHGRPPSEKDALLKLSDQCRNATKAIA